MNNPWLQIPLSDYEGHMAMPGIEQARLLANVFDTMLKEYRPRSVAVLGCAGGNGFDRIAASVTTRVVGVDINPEYVDALRDRYGGRVPNLELIVGDIESNAVRFEPVEFIFAALVLEYVEVHHVLQRTRSLLTAGGILSTVVQLRGAAAPVTPSPYASLAALEPFMELVAPEELARLAGDAGYREIARRREESAGGKQFAVQVFRKHAPQERSVS
jgi:trans-aconitate methyltransferase